MFPPKVTVEGLAFVIGPWAVRRLRPSGFGDSGNDFSRYENPLTEWFRAMWWITSQKNGVSALGLQQVLGWGSCQTAWTCLHELRRFCFNQRKSRRRRAGSCSTVWVSSSEMQEPF